MRADDLLKEPLPDARVGIGVSDGRDIRVPNDVIVYTEPYELVDDLRSGNIDAAVRGSMSSSVLLPRLKEVFHADPLQRVVLMEPVGGRLFLMAPVGIDEGGTAYQRRSLAEGCIMLMKRLGMDGRVAVLSGGRKDDRGRDPAVDRSMDDASALADELRGNGHDAYDAQILIEDAVRDADLVIAPDGISGNLIFRSLHFMGGARALGAPVINIDKVFVDTSRAKADHGDPIALAKRLTEDTG